MFSRKRTLLMLIACATRMLSAQSIEWSTKSLGRSEQKSSAYSSSFPVGRQRIQTIGRLAAEDRSGLLTGFDAAGNLEFVSGFRTASYSSMVNEAALQFVQEYANELNIEHRPEWDFAFNRTANIQGITFVRLFETIRGIAIDGKDVVVGFDHNNRIFQVCLNAARRGTPVGDWVLSEGQAVDAAKRARHFETRDKEIVDRVWSARDDGTVVPAYRLRIPARLPFGDWEYLIDARDGSLIHLKDLMSRSDGLVYNRNPMLDGPNPTRVILADLLPGDSLRGKFATVYSYFPNLLGLVAPDVAVQVAKADSNGNFLYLPGDPRFDEVQLYQAINDVHGRFRNLGLTTLDRPLESAVYWPDAFFQGPYYSSVMFSGRGGIFIAPLLPRLLDPGWDTDVIFHEYTHAVVNALVGPTGTKDFGALNEAFADYFSASFHSDPKLAAFTAFAVGSRFPYLRNLDNPTRYPRDLSENDVHLSGLIWGGALWDIRKALGEVQADAIALRTLGGLSGSSGFFEAALSSVSVAKVLYGQNVSNQVFSIMAQRGILTTSGLSAFLVQDLSPASPVTAQIAAPQSTACVLDDQHEYRIAVPPGANSLSVALGASSNLQLFVRYRQPVTVLPSGPLADYSTSIGTQVGGNVTLQNTPELQAGTYYLAVGSCNPSSVTYAIAATYQGGSINGPPTITALSSGAMSAGSIPPGPTLNSRQFAIQVPTGATGLRVTVQGSTDVDFSIRYGNPVSRGPDGLPLADAYSESPSSTEVINLSSLTTPGLRAGIYYIGVTNADTSQLANFSLTAAVSTTSVIQTTITPLVSNVSAQLSIPAAASGYGILSSSQYSIQVPQNATALTINAITGGASVVLLVRRANPVTVQNGNATYDYSFAPSSQTQFAITPQSYPPVQQGTYYIAAANFSTAPAAFSLNVSITTASSGGAQIASSGIVNAASFSGGVVSPGAVISIFGSNISANTAQAQSVPLPTSLGGVSVTVNSVPAPLFFVSAGQINAQVPFEVNGGTANFVVTARGVSVGPFALGLTDASPGILTLDSSGSGAGVIVDSLAGNVVTVSSPINRGGIATIYAVGFGPVSNRPPSGAVAGATPLSVATGSVSVSIGGRPAKVLFAGLAPGYVGLYQLNIEVPADAPIGHAVTLIASVNGKSSNQVTIAIK